MAMYNPAHPGEVLRDYLGEVDVTALAGRLKVARTTMSRVLNGRSGISAAMALRLARELPNTTPEFWLRMQMNYDLWQARRTMRAPSKATGRTSRAAA